MPTQQIARASKTKPERKAWTQVFMLMGTLLLLPIIFGYMVFVYWIFGGKLREGEGYH
jgi:cytochrome bd ubiquinol oxidase subunit II